MSLTDWVELQALMSPDERCSFQDLRAGLGELGTEPADEQLWARVADVANEVKRRGQLAGSAYPYTEDGHAILKQEGVGCCPYTFCLVVSSKASPRLRKGRVYFEGVSTDAIAAYIDGESLRFGFPRSTPLPKGMTAAVDYLADRIGEERAHNFRLRPSHKDLGLDVVAWKEFQDGRCNKLLVFGQCATGTDWDSKLGEPDLSRWRGLIAWRLQPIQAFAIPFVLSDQEWHEIAYGRLVLDRLRIALLLGAWDPPGNVRCWYRNTVSRLRSEGW